MRESSAIFERLIRGEATSKEYVEAVKREVRMRFKEDGPRAMRRYVERKERQEARLSALEQENARLADALEQDREKWSFDTLLFIAGRLLRENYPPDVFPDTLPDDLEPGPLLAVAVRRARAALNPEQEGNRG